MLDRRHLPKFPTLSWWRTRVGAGPVYQGRSVRPVVPFRITADVIEQILQTIGHRPAESGGMLGGSRDDRVVRCFHFDRWASRTGASYSPDVGALNRLLREQWNPEGTYLLGFVHSHPGSLACPSGGDLAYATRILDAIPELDALLLPIVLTAPDTGRIELRPFAAVRGAHGAELAPSRLDVVDLPSSTGWNREALARLSTRWPDAGADPDDASAYEDPLDEDADPAPLPPARPISEAPALRPDAWPESGRTFERVRDAYDLGCLRRSRVIYVGVGGASSFAEDLARAGVGQHVLIDPDVVSETNLATQQVYRRDLGRPKVRALQERLHDINPDAVVEARQERLEDLSDEDFDDLVYGDLEGERASTTLLCGLTDSFEAQARVNRLALKFGIPSLCAQVYREGRGAEVTFTYPGLTTACHRCILRPRYEAYAKEGFRNDVTSHGTPIFATTWLNAVKGMVALAILHHGTDHARWGGLLARLGNRNLVQLRLDPDVETTLGLTVFDREFGREPSRRTLFGEALWLPQDPEHPDVCQRPACPDCGGTGDLFRRVGDVPDTRKWEG